MSPLALEGVRIVDATMFWAGPWATQLLATMGAEVIKVEAIQHLDGWRAAGSFVPGAEGKIWEHSPLWNAVNINKRGITLDLTRPEGVEIFKELVKISDVVAESYTPRVMENFGLDYASLREVNDRIIMISLPAYGATGPWRDYVGFAEPVEQMSGVPQLTGYPEGPPTATRSGMCDAVAGLNGAFAILTALAYRQKTGKGQYIDLSQIEAVTCLIGEVITDYSLNKRIQARRVNRHLFMAPHSCYRCKGDDLWATIAISSDEEWERFCNTIGSPPWTKEDRFSDSLQRWKNQDELDRLVEAWTIQQDHYEVMRTLQDAGIASGAVLTSAELLTDPHVQQRGVFREVNRAEVGTHPYPVPTAAMRLSKTPGTIRMPAPCLGEHNEHVLRQLLGMSTEAIEDLERNQIIGRETWL